MKPRISNACRLVAIAGLLFSAACAKTPDDPATAAAAAAIADGRVPDLSGLNLPDIDMTPGAKLPDIDLAAFDLSDVDPSQLDIRILQLAYLSQEVTATQVVTALLAKAAVLELGLHAVIAFDPTALKQAARIDSLTKLMQSAGPLHGVPVYIKDNIEMAGSLATTAGARVLADNRPDRDAAIVEKLRAAGAIILGKTNLSEWANFHSSFSSSGQSGVGGQTANPYDITRSPCGSSAGSGVAVAAGYAPLAIGTETNGSIVCPSHANGIVGLKPTVGLLSRRGIIPISESQDTPGPMTRSVRDAAIALTVMQGVDPADRYTAAAAGYAERDYRKSLAKKDALKGKRIGLYMAPMGEHYRVDTLVYQTIRQLEAAGATVIEINQLTTRKAGSRTMDILLYEFKDGLNTYLRSLPDASYGSLASIVAQVDTTAEDMASYDHELLRRANRQGSLGTKAYRDAREEATKIFGEEGIDRVVAKYELDVIIAPTGGPAWKIDAVNGDNFSISSSTPAAVAGYPNLTVPMGQIDGLPVGLSFFGPAWSEPMLIEVGSAWEDLRGRAAGPGALIERNRRKAPQRNARRVRPALCDPVADHRVYRVLFHTTGFNSLAATAPTSSPASHVCRSFSWCSFTGSVTLAPSAK